MGNHRTEKRKSTRTRQRTNKDAVIRNLQIFVQNMNLTQPGNTTPNFNTHHEPMPVNNRTASSVAEPLCEQRSTEYNSAKSVEVQVKVDTHDSGADVKGMLVSLDQPRNKHFSISYWIYRADHTLAKSGITIW